MPRNPFSRFSDRFAADGRHGGRGGRGDWPRDARHDAFLSLRQALLERRGCSGPAADEIAAILLRAAAEVQGATAPSEPGAAPTPSYAAAVAPAPGAMADTAPAQTRHRSQRISLEARRCTLTVRSAEHITPNMLRVELTSPELATFDSRSPDDHVKLFIEDGMRDYTPRAFSRENCSLSIDFALHDAGPATAWALQAKPGDQLQIGGPRGSRVTPDDFDWYLLIGDETALPAIGRRLEELRPDVPVTTMVVVQNKAEVQHIQTRADWSAHWICRDEVSGSDSQILLQALEKIPAPPGEGFVWIAGEAKIARNLRDYFVNQRHHPRQWLKAAGYWVRGRAGAHEKFD